MPTDHLVVLAAGRGTRMDPLTRTRPKVLLPVAGRPLAGHVVEAAGEAGFRRVTWIVGEGADAVRQTFGDVAGMDVAFVDQGRPQGTGHAVAALAGHVDEAFVLVSGDSVLSAKDLQRLASVEGEAVGGRIVEDARPYGLLDVQGDRVMGVQEKPSEPVGGPVNGGAYRFEADVVRRCASLRPSPRGELELTDVLAQSANDGAPARFVETPSWREAGRPWELLDLQASLMEGMATRIEGDVGERVDIEGPVVVEPGARVLNGTRIEGPCWIGRDVRVGPNAYLRPATYLADGSHAGGHVQVKNSIIGEGSHVPHLSYVGDSVFGRDCNLGAGTQVANLKVSPRSVRVHWQGTTWIDTGRRKLGAILGDGVKTGVNCSINPGTVLCPDVRIGAGQPVSGWVEPQAVD